MTKFCCVIVAALAAAFFAGCSQESDTPPATKATMPEVNDENCKPESVANVDESVRTQFGTACSRRGSFKPSSGKGW